MLTKEKRILKIIIADDHALIREGLKALIMTMDHLEVVGEAASMTDLFSLLPACHADFLVLDLGMPGLTRLDDIRTVKEEYPFLKILILTANQDPKTVAAALCQGADGYLVKSADLSEFPLAVNSLRQGARYLDRTLQNEMNAFVKPDNHHFRPEPMTPREQELLTLIARGLSTRDAAGRMGISLATARKHRENLMRKQDLHNTAELTAFALRLGLPTL